MLELFQFVFDDFWRFLQFCVILMIIALWKPIDVTILNGQIQHKDDEE